MKKFISGLIVGILITTTFAVFASSYNVVPNPFKVIVDGNDKGQIGYLIDNSTYLPLRQMGEIIGKDVDFQDNTIYVGIIPTADKGEYVETTYNDMKAFEYDEEIYLVAEDALEHYSYEVEITAEAFVLTSSDSKITINRNDKQEVIIVRVDDDTNGIQLYTCLNKSLFE